MSIRTTIYVENSLKGNGDEQLRLAFYGVPHRPGDSLPVSKSINSVRPCRSELFDAGPNLDPQ